ncbi:MAG: hypothetical protein WBX25_17505 [Rhodomicrobium sp.]
MLQPERLSVRNAHYPWLRFWAPHDGSIDLSDAGFLRDPIESLGRGHGPSTLGELETWKALVLLGEPGIGKSTTLKEEANRVESLAASTGHVSFYVDLHEFSSEDRLCKRIFESEQFLAWKNGNSNLFLHLDSLDEALLRIDAIANLLASELRDTPTERMSIRIACRTAVWPANTLGVALTSIWGDASGVFELAPLRRRDIIAALDMHDIEVEGFMRALFGTQATPFAIKPLTLKMLLRIYEQGGELPKSNVELYKRGCLALCEEPNDSRRDSGRLGRLNASQRMRLAGRIAAATVIGNRFAVWKGPEVKCPREDIAVSGLSGRPEEGEFGAFTATDNDVREALDTGLFSSRGEARMGWAHQGYGEFLAALYLFGRGVPPESTLKVLLHPAGGLIPQLALVAAWAASLSSEVRAALIIDEPLALLRGDLSGWSADDRGLLVKSLLDSVERKQVTDSPYSNAEAYAKLAHAELANQLRRVIVDGQKSIQARRLALLIAEKCRLTELQPDLLKVALDIEDRPEVRSSAVSALQHCGDATVPALVRPLADGRGGADPLLDIKGNALDLLWPEHITAAELFQVLTPSADNYFGSYALFKSALPDRLKTADLLPALEWSTQVIERSRFNGGYQDKSLADAIMFRSWQVFEEPELTQPFLRHMVARLQEHGDLCRGTNRSAQEAFETTLKNDVSRRRKFLMALSAENLTPIAVYAYKRTGLLNEADFEWLLAISPGGANSESGLDEETLCNFIGCLFVSDNVAHFEALYATAERWPKLRARYASFFEGIPIDSPDVERWRQQRKELRTIEEGFPPPISADPLKDVLSELAEAEAGDWNAWWKLTNYLALTPKSRSFVSELNFFITEMPVWKEADEAVRQRIVVSAERYLYDAEPNVTTWLGHNPMTIMWDAVAGLRALILLQEVSPERYDRIANEAWRKWAPVIVGFSHVNGERSPLIAQVRTDALTHAEAESVSAVLTIIQRERERIRAAGETPAPGLPFFILRNLDDCWENAALRDAVYEELCKQDNTPAEYASFLDSLSQAGDERAIDHALSMLAISEHGARDKKLAIADVVLRRAVIHSWPTLKPLIDSDDEFARDVLLSATSHSSFSNPFYIGLSERDTADLYSLMIRLFPGEDERKPPAGLITEFDGAGHLRDSIPRYLAERGTVAAVEVLGILVARHPELGGLVYELSLAERIMRAATWSPLTPKEIMALTDRPTMKLVTSPADLFQILRAALEKFAQDLHGAQTPVRDLWDRQQSKDMFRPIDEAAISDVITRFLRTELGAAGVFANREVEISRVPGTPLGRRTDILINTVRRRADNMQYDSIAAVIEVKGCWNRELFTGLEEQLFRDYMIRLRAPIGIYLVPWFETESWDDKDSRRGQVPKIPMDEAQRRLEQQAAGLPEGFLVSPFVFECRIPSS